MICQGRSMAVAGVPHQGVTAEVRGLPLLMHALQAPHAMLSSRRQTDETWMHCRIPCYGIIHLPLLMHCRVAMHPKLSDPDVVHAWKESGNGEEHGERGGCGRQGGFVCPCAVNAWWDHSIDTGATSCELVLPLSCSVTVDDR